VRRTITAFLLTQMNNGAFRWREPAKAFFVDVSEQLNTPTVLRISQDTRAIEAELAAAGV